MLEKIIVHQQYAGFEDLKKQFGPRDDVPDMKEVVDPVGEMFQRAPAAAALKSANGATCVFDFGFPPESDVDSEENSPFYKLPQVVRHESATPSPDAFTKRSTSKTLAERLGIVKTAVRTDENGTRWAEGFNADGVLVNTRVLLPRKIMTLRLKNSACQWLWASVLARATCASSYSQGKPQHNPIAQGARVITIGPLILTVLSLGFVRLRLNLPKASLSTPLGRFWRLAGIYPRGY